MNAKIPKHIEAALDDAYCAGPAKEELILAIEQSLGVVSRLSIERSCDVMALRCSVELSSME